MCLDTKKIHNLKKEKLLFSPKNVRLTPSRLVLWIRICADPGVVLPLKKRIKKYKLEANMIRSLMPIILCFAKKNMNRTRTLILKAVGSATLQEKIYVSACQQLL